MNDAIRIMLVLCLVAACGDVADAPRDAADPPRDAAPPSSEPVFGRELSAAAGRMSSARFQLDFQCGRGPMTVTASSPTHTVEPATPIRSN